jgi:hypothetical protein
MYTTYAKTIKPLNDRLSRWLNNMTIDPSRYDCVDFNFIHDDGFAITATAFHPDNSASYMEVNEDFTIGEALDELDQFIKQADNEFDMERY